MTNKEIRYLVRKAYDEVDSAENDLIDDRYQIAIIKMQASIELQKLAIAEIEKLLK